MDALSSQNPPTPSHPTEQVGCLPNEQKGEITPATSSSGTTFEPVGKTKSRIERRRKLLFWSHPPGTRLNKQAARPCLHNSGPSVAKKECCRLSRACEWARLRIRRKHIVLRELSHQSPRANRSSSSASFQYGKRVIFVLSANCS